MKPRLYLETTIPSYLVARRSRDLRLAADQETTEEWWATRRKDFDLFVSEAVLEEVSRGDAGFAAARLAALRGLPVLGDSPMAVQVTKRLLAEGIIPPVAADDATHRRNIWNASSVDGEFFDGQRHHRLGPGRHVVAADSPARSQLGFLGARIPGPRQQQQRLVDDRVAQAEQDRVLCRAEYAAAVATQHELVRIEDESGQRAATHRSTTGSRVAESGHRKALLT